jgi:hypothetical protein
MRAAARIEYVGKFAEAGASAPAAATPSAASAGTLSAADIAKGVK